MFSTEQVNEFQTRFSEAVKDAQKKAQDRAKEFEKVLETLGDRAQAELKTLLSLAQSSSREQMGALGVELEKLGKKLQELATQPVKSEKPVEAAAADGNATQPPPASVQ